ncbi:ATP-binding protein [Candidatus Bathyarchaeota archaeon]|nr:ATP-binding protein [Candidatus Bathyarchaeota archaeon]
MKISRTTIDKLGIKMYDKASAVVAELIANSYDADAELVTVTIPLNSWLATKKGNETVDRGLEIVVEDDGHGMPPEVINDFYLKVGSNPRLDEKRGRNSLEKKRPRMGRKGIGKLAPFGICKIIEVRSAGGERTVQGYKTAHFIMDFDKILKDTDSPYHPDRGEFDGKYSERRGTTIILKNFNRRRTPDQKTFNRQLARRFGSRLPDFEIKVVDTAAKHGEENEWIIGGLDLEINEETLIELEKIGTEAEGYKDIPKLTLEDGTELALSGWIAYSKKAYKNPEMAGIRIYARGKIASTTRDFGIKSGFTGEYKLRSYLIGEILADWIDEDEDEDLIRSDRQDILWETEKGTALRKWGQKILKILAKKARTPMRKIARREFMEKSNLEEEAKKRYKDSRVVASAIEVGKTIGSIASLDDLQDPDYVEDLKELVLTFAPHKMLVDKLREAASEDIDKPITALVKLFNDAKVAETASLGQVVQERIRIIKKLELLLGPGKKTHERDLQRLLEDAPWLIDPQWTVLQANRQFESMRIAFERWFEKTYGAKIITSTVESETRRPDFIMLHVGSNIEIVEIKNVDHTLADEEFNRILTYYVAVEGFMNDNPTLKKQFPFLHISLICDKLDLQEQSIKLSYKKLYEDNLLVKKTWEELLIDTRKVHEAFLEIVES